MTLEQIARELRELIAEMQTIPPHDATEADYGQCERAALVAERMIRPLGAQSVVDRLRAASGPTRTLHALGAALEFVQPKPQQEWMTVQQAAEAANVGRDAIEDAIRAGELPASDLRTKRKHCYRINRQSLNEWLESKRVRVVAKVSDDAIGRHYPKKRRPT